MGSKGSMAFIFMNFETVKSYLTSTKKIEREINGNNVEFYPLKTRILKELKEFAGPLAEAITLYNSAGSDSEVTIKRDEKSGSFEQNIKAIDSNLASVRMTERLTAARKIADIISNEQTRILAARVILNSLRVEDAPKEPAKLSAMIEEMDIDVFADFIMGIIEVHKESFAPLVANLRRYVVPAQEPEEE